jgi:hypothetical protein
MKHFCQVFWNGLGLNKNFSGWTRERGGNFLLERSGNFLLAHGTAKK